MTHGYAKWTSLCAAIFLLLSCKDSPTDERVASRLALSTSEDGGVIQALFSALSSQAQLMSVSSGDLQGSSVLIPPGALSFDVSVSVSATESIANAAQAADLGIASVAFAAAGPSVLVAPSTTTELAVPMQLSIPIATTSLALDDETENYVIVYKAYALKDGATIQYAGLIPRSDIVIANGYAKFKTTRFGAFQVAKTSVKVEAAISQPSTVEIGKVPGYDLVGQWRGCGLKRDQSTEPKWQYETLRVEKVGLLTYESLEAPQNSSVNCPDYSSITTPWMRVSIQGSFDAGGLKQVTLPGERSGDTRAIDFKITRLSVIVYDANEINRLNDYPSNTNRACGVTWVAGEARELSSMECMKSSASGTYDGPVVGAPRFGIYNISPFTVAGESVKFLLLDDAGTEDSRPSAFATDSGRGMQKIQ